MDDGARRRRVGGGGGRALSYRVVDTTDMTPAEMVPYWGPLLVAMQKLCDRFPDDLSVPAMLFECRDGLRRVWLILDEAGAFVSFAMTKIYTVAGTGARVATLMDLAGDEGHACADEICAALEGWADREAAPIRDVTGRLGWKRELEKRGYRVHSVTYRKVKNV